MDQIFSVVEYVAIFDKRYWGECLSPSENVKTNDKMKNLIFLPKYNWVPQPAGCSV